MTHEGWAGLGDVPSIGRRNRGQIEIGSWLLSAPMTPVTTRAVRSEEA